MEIEKLKLYLDFAKFFLASVVVALVTFWVNSGFKDREIAIKEQEYLAQFKDDALSEDIELRRRLAEYFSKVTVSLDARERWVEYLGLLEGKLSEQKQTEARIALLESQLADETVEVDAQEIARVRNELETERLKAAQLERELTNARTSTNASATRNYTVPSVPRDIELIIVTDTETPSLRSALNVVSRAESNVSYHYVIGTDGAVAELVDEAYIAWHAGRSSWKGKTNLNSLSIGIGLVHLSSADGSNWANLPATHPAVGPDYPVQQLESLVELLADIAQRQDVGVENILTKQDVAPGRRRTDLFGEQIQTIRAGVSELLEAANESLSQ